MVEEGPVKDLFRNPRHPYTRGLLNCRPALHVKGERLPVVSDYLEGKEPAAAGSGGAAMAGSPVCAAMARSSAPAVCSMPIAGAHGATG